MIKYYMVSLRKTVSIKKKSVEMLFQISGFGVFLFIIIIVYKYNSLFFFSVRDFKIYAILLIMNKCGNADVQRKLQF